MRVVLSILACVVCLKGAVLEVSPEQSIQQFVNASSPGHTILLHGGEFFESIVLRQHNLTIGSNFVFSRDTNEIATVVWHPADSGIDTASCLIVLNLHDEYTRVEGLTLRAGEGTNWEEGPGISGGAIYSINSKLAVSNARITNCSAGFFGGAILSIGNINLGPVTKLSVVDCKIDSCSSGQWGGGIYADDCSLHVQGSTFLRNHAFQDGGGLIALDCMTEIEESSFLENSGVTGGAFLSGARGSVINSFFMGNSASDIQAWAAHLSVGLGRHIVTGCYFGELGSNAKAVNTCCDHSDTVTFTDNTLEHNQNNGSILTGNLAICGVIANVSGNVFRYNRSGLGQVYVFCDGRANIHNNLFQENTPRRPDRPTVLCTATGGTAEFINNQVVENMGETIGYIPEFPQTIDARNNWWGSDTGPYHPTRNPFGQGDTILSDSVLFDPWLLSPPDTTSSTNPPHVAQPSTWQIVSLYPNPFNSELSIAIAGIMSPAFSLRLYDLLGREVAILSEGHGHGTMINYTAPPDLATGVYFLRASDATTVQTRKVVFLK